MTESGREEMVIRGYGRGGSQSPGSGSDRLSPPPTQSVNKPKPTRIPQAAGPRGQEGVEHGRREGRGDGADQEERRRYKAGKEDAATGTLNSQLRLDSHARSPGLFGDLLMCPRPSPVPAAPRTLGHELDLVGHGGAQLVAGKAAIGALKTLGEVAVVARDGEGARVGGLVHGHTRLLLGFEEDAVPSPAEPAGRNRLRGLRPGTQDRSWHRPRQGCKPPGAPGMGWGRARTKGDEGDLGCVHPAVGRPWETRGLEIKSVVNPRA